MPSRRKILVVEDEAAVRGEVETALRSYGFNVSVAASPTSALAQLEKDRYDALVLDLVLDGGDGIPILDLLRTSKRDLPVIVMTQYLTSYVKEMTAYFSQVKLIVAKPFPASAVVASVAAVTGVTQNSPPAAY